MLAACLLELRRLPDVRRPAIAVTIPARSGPSRPDRRRRERRRAARRTCSSSPTWAPSSREEILDVRNPEVRLLSIGEEAEKGNLLDHRGARAARRAATSTSPATRRAATFSAARADVVVTDGFTGNVALKILEGTITNLLDAFREEITATTRGKLGGLLIRPAGAPPPRPPRPRHLRRRLPARPPRSRRHRARKLLPPRDRERGPPRRPRRRARRRRHGLRSASRSTVLKSGPSTTPTPNVR